jgi:NADH-quinone oxidoreductase subunit L
VIFSPFVSALFIAIFVKKIPKRWIHRFSILSLLLSIFCLLPYLIHYVWIEPQKIQSYHLYTWATIGNISLNIGLMLDHLSLIMATLILSIGLMVNFYSMQYIRRDETYARFFIYLSLFIFFMMIFVLANNVFQLFFSMEIIALMVYLFIGFWYKKSLHSETSFHALIGERMSHFGFLIAIAGLASIFKTFDYSVIFEHVQHNKTLIYAHILNEMNDSTMTIVLIGFLIGGIGKTLHIPSRSGLLKSLEAPVPFSIFIYSFILSMGIFIFLRLSPLFKGEIIISYTLLTIGTLLTLVMSYLGSTQKDSQHLMIYSTLSHLNYILVLLGVFAYFLSFFNLIVYIFSTALLLFSNDMIMRTQHFKYSIHSKHRLLSLQKNESKHHFYPVIDVKKDNPVLYFIFLIASLSLLSIDFLSNVYLNECLLFRKENAEWDMLSMVYILLSMSLFLISFFTFRFILQLSGTLEITFSKKILKRFFVLLSVPIVILICLFVISLYILSLNGEAVLISYLKHPSIVQMDRYLLPDFFILMLHSIQIPAFYWLIMGIIGAYIYEDPSLSAQYLKRWNKISQLFSS